MTYETLKYYCNEGLIPNVKRDSNNRRVFDQRDVKWIQDLVCLKKCGMSIQEMKDYLALCLQGRGPFPQRKEMLAQKAGRPIGLHPRTGGQRGLYPLEAVVLRRSALRPTPLCEQPDRPQRVTRQKKVRRTAVPFAWNVLRCLVREIEKEHDRRRAPRSSFFCLPRQIPHPRPQGRGASGTPSRGVWAAPKPSAQGEFISPEQVPSSGQREKARPTSCLFLWSECNYRTWKSSGISMVCRPSA